MYFTSYSRLESETIHCKKSGLAELVASEVNKSDNSTQWTLVIPIYHEALDMLGLGKLSRIISRTMKAVLWPVQCTRAAPDDALVEEEGRLTCRAPPSPHCRPHPVMEESITL